jgi:hypothetical protein
MTATSHSSRLADLLPAWSFGALEGDELRELAAHLEPGCPACDAELRRLAAVVEALAAAAAMPPEELAGEVPAMLEGVNRRLLAQVAAEPRTSSTPGPLPPRLTAAPGPTTTAGSPAAVSRPPTPQTPQTLETPQIVRRRAAARRPWLSARPWLPAVAAAAALALVAAWGAARQAALGSEIERLRGERRQLLARARSLEDRVTQVEAESQRLARTLAIIAAPGVESVRLAAMGSSRAAGRTFVNAGDRRAVFYAFDLPALGPDKTYQLWYIDDQERKTSAGTFNVDAHGKASLVVDTPLPVERIQAWAVTVEPRGGMPQPTGPMVLAG